MILRFSKMHGLGNDFIVIDGITQKVELAPSQIRLLANRRLGVGCDQVLVVAPPKSDTADFSYRIFNADGQEVEQCGNGARCFARFVRDRRLTDAAEIRVETGAGLIILHMEPDGLVTVNMGPPRFEPTDIPFEAQTTAPSYDLQVNGDTIEISAVSMGNPHAVLMVDNIQTAPVTQIGPLIERHPRFPNRVNVGFMNVVDSSHVHLRVYERGSGETLACGSGACAAVVAGRIRGLLDEQVAVDLPGGRLMISWAGNGAPVMMAGPATQVFDGTIDV